MFDIRTPKRVYFLAADSESDMNSWVSCICHVCGLKVFYREDEETTGSSLTLTRPVSTASSTMTIQSATLARTLQSNHLLEDTPPTSPTSPTGSSGPYFPLSECLSGSRSLIMKEAMAASVGQPSSAPVTPAPTARGLGLGTQSLRGKPRREDWDLFYDQPRQLSAAAGQGLGQSQQQLPTAANTNGQLDDQAIHDAIRSFEDKFSRSFKRLQPAAAAQSTTAAAGGQKFVPPPRPPKPAHLIEHPSHNYLNLEQLQSPSPMATGGGPRSPPSISPPLPTPTNADSW